MNNSIIGKFLKIIFTILFFAVQNSYALENKCPENNSSVLFGEFNNENKLIEYWKPKLEKLYSAIPNLSPKEEKWLNDEIAAGGDRLSRISSSNEFAIRVVKWDIGDALFVMQNKINVNSKLIKIVAWSEFVYYLTWRSDLAFYIDMLIHSGNIKISDLPPSWILLGETTKDKINFGKMLLSSNILGCIIPKIAE